MVTILPAVERRPSLGQRLSEGIGKGLESGSQMIQQHQQKQAQRQAFERLGLDPEIANLPNEYKKMAYEYALKGGFEKQKQSSELQGNDAILRDLEERRDLPKGSLNAYRNDPKAAEQVTRPVKETKQALTEKEVPFEISRKIKKIIADNPKSNADDLRIQMDEAGIPPVYSNPYTENRRRTEEQTTKSEESRINELRKETLPIRSDIAKKAMASSQGIRNKEHLLELIEKGDINDPTFAALAEALPLNLGKRMLSNDTIEYKAGMIEEFNDLKNIFPGQVRVKEIELLEQKMADLFLTDDQKKSVLKSRINALKADEIRAEVAQEIENKPLGILQFQNELEKIAKPKLEALFNQILDEQKSIFQNAENRKKVPLDLKDPDDKQIVQQIFLEAGKDWNKAEKLAKKKGYTW